MLTLIVIFVLIRMGIDKNEENKQPEEYLEEDPTDIF